MHILHIFWRKRNMVFVPNHLDHMYYSEPLENRYIVFKKYVMLI